MKVYINAPKTPVTAGSNGVAAATVPNVCKMPGPPAPFVPTPLPNIGKSGDSPKKYSKKVKVQGKAVAIKGASFKSVGDAASKGTGGGLLSANTHGPTKFVGPGALDVKVEGKNVQLLGDPMLNNCGPSGTPPNAATVVGVVQTAGMAALFGDEDCPLCGKAHGNDGKLEEDKDTQGACSQLIAAANAAVAAATVARQSRLQALLKSKINDLSTQAQNISPTGGLKKIKQLHKKRKKLIESGPNESWIREPKISGMAGVVKCKDCDNIYAGFSMRQYSDVQARMPAGWHSPTAYTNTLGDKLGAGGPPTVERFLPYVGAGRQEQFRTQWRLCEDRNEEYNDPDEDLDESFNPPGQCAAQQMVLLALDHGCRPVGLTERWYKSNTPAARFAGDVYYRTLDDNEEVSAPTKAPANKFGGDDAVPPCGTCQVILNSLMCTEDRAPGCEYKKPDEGVCICTPKRI